MHHKVIFVFPSDRSKVIKFVGFPPGASRLIPACDMEAMACLSKP